MQIVLLLVGIGIGIVIGWLIAKNKITQLASPEDRALLISQLNDAKKEIEKYKSDEKVIHEKVTALSGQLATSSANNEHLQERLTQQKQELEELQTRFTKE